MLCLTGFYEADEDGNGALDVQEFVHAFSGHFPHLGDLELQHLFMKIDANADGNVDWSEFLTYMATEGENAIKMRLGLGLGLGLGKAKTLSK